MKNHVWTGDKKKRAISGSDLKMRLDLNKKYQSKDFQSWLRKRLNVKPGEKILDIGCGNGAQTFFMAEDAGENGHVTSFDISKDSIQNLRKSTPHYLKNRISSFELDMGEVANFLKKNYPNNNYSLAQSSYALYYSPKRIDVLSLMQDKTKDFGRVSIFTPAPPHGMISFVSKFQEISDPVSDSLYFGENVLKDIFRKCFWDVEIHYFQSRLKITSFNDFQQFYEATTYFDKDASEEIYKNAILEIEKNGSLNFEKCGILLIGSSLRRLANEI
ncbi:methyltransferase domain-containing protein [Prochlorococcus marinus]|uniref:methyltransferase domain-containing protein n=1 Tax=Prochlorococcus marinus TaxID=1219 RepID=UPI001ADA50C5|nr:methyltransferase domain-containing protein [Prochlorococcus marinus]MBO8219559.1 class I SAM-dependent methyltransferase [Prochlorococcus marinus CUG1416]MBW3051930.1 hypothetical protein [Prochlorococcus marinus str. MU1416]